MTQPKHVKKTCFCVSGSFEESELPLWILGVLNAVHFRAPIQDIVGSVVFAAESRLAHVVFSKRLVHVEPGCETTLFAGHNALAELIGTKHLVTFRAKVTPLC